MFSLTDYIFKNILPIFKKHGIEILNFDQNNNTITVHEVKEIVPMEEYKQQLTSKLFKDISDICTISNDVSLGYVLSIEDNRPIDMEEVMFTFYKIRK